MSKNFFEEYSAFVGQQRKKDKKKRHTKGFSEDFQDKRAQRINFKKYIRELEEQELEDDLDNLE
jgi:hypothetical protein